MSNLCSEILQVQEPSAYNEDLTYAHVGRDISCNLGSLNIAKAMDGGLGHTVETAIRATHLGGRAHQHQRGAFDSPRQ